MPCAAPSSSSIAFLHADAKLHALGLLVAQADVTVTLSALPSLTRSTQATAA